MPHTRGSHVARAKGFCVLCPLPPSEPHWEGLGREGALEVPIKEQEGGLRARAADKVLPAASLPGERGGGVRGSLL